MGPAAAEPSCTLHSLRPLLRCSGHLRSSSSPYKRTASSHGSAVSRSDFTAANSAVGLSFSEGCQAQIKAFSFQKRLEEDRGQNLGAQRVPSLAGVLLRREVCLPTVGTLWA